MIEYEELEILGLKRQLPILPSPSGIKIAGFNPVGDMELLQKSAKYLFNLLQNENIKYDIILTTELKGLPIAQEIASISQKNYVCLRKEAKCYMLNPIKTESESITSGKSTYYISQTELLTLKNKRVLFVDDVFSTGGTLINMLKFAKEQDFEIIACATILREVKKQDIMKNKNVFTFNGINIYYCDYLPLP